MNNEINDKIHKTIDDFNGIVPYNEAFYLESILYSTMVCLNAFATYDDNKDKFDDPHILVSILQEAVGHAAAVSRYFGPFNVSSNTVSLSKKLILKRRSKLCEAFDLNESSVLFDRNLRNAWEHFDERLDMFLLIFDAGYVLPQVMLGDINILDNSLNKVFKLLDIENECIVLLGEKYYFGKIRDEVNTIHSKCSYFLEHGARLP